MGKSRAKQRKQGDKWYYLAKEQGYRSRSSFKLIQLNKKYHFLEKTKVLIDLCAAPGGWLQVASKYCISGSLICGVDLIPIKPIPNVITFVEDITTDKCRGKLRHYLKTWKADTILHDGAPNVGVSWLHDAYSQTELVLMKVEATKPLASRDVSAEIFVICQEYKAPDKIDPKFFDPKFVFEDLPDSSQDHKSRVFNPSKKRRQRDGYEDGNYIQHKTISVEDFLMSNNPIEILSIASAISLDDRDLKNYKGIKDLDITTKEIIACCQDLRVLGKKDFRGLLKWRILAREKLGLIEKKENNSLEKIEIEPLNEEEEIEEEMKRLNNEEIMRKKREKRRILELKQKNIRRMQLGMIEAMDIGLEQTDMIEEESFFKIPSNELDKLEIEDEKIDLISDDINATEFITTEFEDTENELDNLEDELHQIKKKKLKSKANIDFDDDGDIKLNNREDALLKEEPSFDFKENNKLDRCSLEDISESSEYSDFKERKKLSRKAQQFFDNDVFKIHNNFQDFDINKESMKNNSSKNIRNQIKSPLKVQRNNLLDDNVKILYEKNIENNQVVLVQENKNKRKSEIDIITAEAMELAQNIASGKKSKRDIIDDAYNKWSFQDNDNLPEWFLDDEKKHNKRNIPVSKEAVMAIREKMKAINARPIKKVLEAKIRKKMKAIKKMKKIQLKTNSIIETRDMTEKEKSESVRKLLKKAAKFQYKDKVKIVFAKGANKGIKGRPKGVKGRYKIVDSRMKKDLRAAKRVAKRRK
ncbi:hypothetical protein PMAC_002526 [Pneumocystis sp. 'macacae']|nr:hypothetical protein PMAC_002526 [Pneumocystis sp. 'macacae']